MKRGDMTDQKRKETIVALLREREMCQARGLGGRVKLIDEQLAFLGHEAKTPDKRSERRPSPQRGRSAR